jgi:hypothetical protein
MRKEIKVTDEKLGVVRVTTTDERWYAKPVADDKTGLPLFKALPSVTWIVSVYPKLGLQRLRDEVGADEMELMKKLGGERGSKVHEACSAIIRGEEVRIDSKFVNPNTEQLEELTADEARYIISFVDWVKKSKPKFLAWDATVYSEKHGYAGTLDFVAEIGGEIFLVDIKTSKVIGTDYEMQVSAYRECLVNLENDIGIKEYLGDMKLAILQLGTKPLKTDPSEYRWKEVPNRFDLFLATRKIWEDVYHTQVMDARGFSQKDYPLVLSPALKAEDITFGGVPMAEAVKGLPVKKAVGDIKNKK